MQLQRRRKRRRIDWWGMNEWTNKWMNRQMNEWMNEHFGYVSVQSWVKKTESLVYQNDSTHDVWSWMSKMWGGFYKTYLRILWWPVGHSHPCQWLIHWTLATVHTFVPIWSLQCPQVSVWLQHSLQARKCYYLNSELIHIVSRYVLPHLNFQFQFWFTVLETMFAPVLWFNLKGTQQIMQG